MNVFDEMGVYWAEMADQNQTESQIQFLKKHLGANRCVLDLACGTGRHTIPLNQMGFGVVGLDVSSKLLKIAKQRSKQVQLVRGDMRFLPFKSETFGATVSMDTSFGYLPTEQEDKAALAEVQRTLTRKGIFVIDVFNRQELTLKYRVDENQPFKQKEYPSFFLQQKRTVTPKGDWLCDLWIVQDKTNGRESVFEHAVRLYEHGKLEVMLDKAGFAVKEVYGGYEGENFGFESTHLILIVQRK
jgi:ubiquinone/menaquinone biosynthesis C-methylase UbiE